MQIKIYGPGCARCQETENLVRAVVQESGRSANVEKISDLKTMMAQGILTTPAIVIDGKIMSAGRLPSRAEIMGWMGGRS